MQRWRCCYQAATSAYSVEFAQLVTDDRVGCDHGGNPRGVSMAWLASRRSIVLASLFLMSGCAFGPRALERTHGLYAAAIQQVDEEQFLRNIVRLRYLESPT